MASNMTIYSVAGPANRSQFPYWARRDGAVSEDAMVPLIILGVATAGMLGLIGFGATRIFRRRRIQMADLPELPSPGGEPGKIPPGQNGPTMQA